MCRSDVAGSLLRPAYLKEARDQFASGHLSDAAFKQIENRAGDECIVRLVLSAASFQPWNATSSVPLTKGPSCG